MRAVAVPYIIALILGVAVIGLIGYWFASSGGKFAGQSAKTVCDNKFLQWCIINTGGVYANFRLVIAECTNVDGSYSTCSEITGSGRDGERGGGCSCGGWTDVACGRSPCIQAQMKQTRSCSPSGCDSETRCVSTPSCGGGRCVNPPACSPDGSNSACCDGTCQFGFC